MPAQRCHRHLCVVAGTLLASTLLASTSAAVRGDATATVPAAPSSTAGFVAGDERPDVEHAVAVPGGWLVPYDETIPGTGVVFNMMPIPGGTFRMGTPGGGSPAAADSAGGGSPAAAGAPGGGAPAAADETPVFEVRVPPFWMGRCEVTWAEYTLYMKACDLFKSLEAAGIRPVTADNEADAVTAPSNLYDPTTTFTNGEQPELPAVTMTQFAARQYTKWLSGLTDRFYRLPSEAEWEYACRAGTTTPWSCGDAPDDLHAVAWFADNADDTTHPVGQKQPNAWGLHDMHGNVAEWVVDELVAGGYARQGALPQPVEAAAAITWPQRLYPRVLRGGAYYDEATECRSAARRGSRDAGGTASNPDWKDVDPNLPKSPWWYTEEPALGVGMRLVRPWTPPDPEERRRWWNADEPSIVADAADRLAQGRGARGIVDPKLPDEARAAGLSP